MGQVQLELGEEWRDVPGWEGVYMVSNWGRVVSRDREILKSNGRLEQRRGKLMTTSPGHDGYVFVHLRCGARSKAERVHRLVAAAFLLGRKLERHEEVDHRFGDKEDNRPCMLEMVTPEENKRRLAALYELRRRRRG